MKLLVTGGAGFIGSAVVRLAISRGHEVVNLDGLGYAANLANIAMVSNSPFYRFERADIRDRAALDRVLATHRPDAILHLAAESHVDRSIERPGAFVETNVVGTFRLLEAALAYWTHEGRPGGFRFHHVSTDEVFGSLGPEGLFDEGTPYSPRSPYSATKAAADHLVRAWHETYGLPTLVTNSSDNYGPFQLPEKLVPVAILNALRRRPIPVFGDGRNVRDWLFVEDHAEALLLVVTRGEVGRTYVIGGQSEMQNHDLVRLICRLMDELRPTDAPHERLIAFVEDRLGHDFRYAVDSVRIRQELGWRPSVSLLDGLRRTVAWYVRNEPWWRPLVASEDRGVGTESAQGTGDLPS